MRALFLSILMALAAPLHGQPAITGRAEALDQDALLYAQQHGVPAEDARRRLRLQQASVTVTDAIAREFADRLAGISIDNGEHYRINVLLAGEDKVADREVSVDGTSLPLHFISGARATRAQAIAALRKHLIDLRAELPGARGAGYDQRTGEVVLLVRRSDVDRFGSNGIRERAERIGGVPVRIVVNELLESNMMLAGGGRIEGPNSVTGRRNVCTAGFVVSDGTRRGLATAAHCPDAVTYRDPDEGDIALPFAGQWGVGYHDVQVNVSASALRPLFYSDRRAGTLRRLDSWRNRDSTRAGDFVCHYGESSGYSCGDVELTDYAPPGTLCGGPCWPSWVTVRGPGCAPGDSGGPVFAGSVAFGLAKGVNRSASGRCNFYYYMSTDYLPPPWMLLTAGAAP